MYIYTYITYIYNLGGKKIAKEIAKESIEEGIEEVRRNEEAMHRRKRNREDEKDSPKGYEQRIKTRKRIHIRRRIMKRKHEEKEEEAEIDKDEVEELEGIIDIFLRTMRTEQEEEQSGRKARLEGPKLEENTRREEENTSEKRILGPNQDSLYMKMMKGRKGGTLVRDEGKKKINQKPKKNNIKENQNINKVSPVLITNYFEIRQKDGRESRQWKLEGTLGTEDRGGKPNQIGGLKTKPDKELPTKPRIADEMGPSVRLNTPTKKASAKNTTEEDIKIPSDNQDDVEMHLENIEIIDNKVDIN